MSYRPYIWMGEDQDRHISEHERLEADAMNKWVRNLPTVADEMGWFAECHCGELMLRSVIDEEWILEHYEHRRNFNDRI